MQRTGQKSDYMRVWTRLLRGLVPMALLLSVIALFVPQAGATTLEQLTLDEMALKSTAIVRARVTGSRAGTRSGNIYTYFRLEVLDNWKGHAVTEVAVPGGEADGIRQTAAGAPELKPGQEYVLFLWTSRSGLTQVMGLSQGLFRLSGEGSGEAVAQRAATSELMLNPSGLPVEDRAVNMPLHELRTRVRQALATAKLGGVK
jgi:hypothetical protein